MTLAVIFSAASLIICCFSFIYLKTYLARRTGAERILADFKDEVNKLITEIDAATDRDAALVEDRIKTLRALLEDADRRISVYARELNRRHTQEAAYAALGRRPAAAKQAGSESGEPRPQAVLRAAGPGEFPAENSAAPDTALLEQNAVLPERAEQNAVSQEKTAEGPGRKTAKRAGRKDSAELPLFVRAERDLEPAPPSFAEQAAELSKAGLSPDLIAKRLGAAVAEVNLALAISRRR